MKKTFSTIALIALAAAALAGPGQPAPKSLPKIVTYPEPVSRVVISGTNWYFLSGHTVIRLNVPRDVHILRGGNIEGGGPHRQ